MHLRPRHVSVNILLLFKHEERKYFNRTLDIIKFNKNVESTPGYALGLSELFAKLEAHEIKMMKSGFLCSQDLDTELWN